MRWHRIPPKPAGRIEKVRGRAAVVQSVRGPLDGHEGLLVMTVLASQTWSGTQMVQTVTANDFLLEADGGESFVVRASDIVFRWGWLTERYLLGWDGMEPVRRLLPAAMQETIAGTPLRPPAALRCRDIVVPSGSRLEARGLTRQEPAQFGMPGSGFRGQALVPTLTGGGGRLELRYIFPELRLPPGRDWPRPLEKSR
ncbi:MAG: hypothetical protein HYY06_32110 [Deltaproteobacteria bacterium]|nr:hypothetical protein [Deltaproteobacteria bacterium]